MNTISLCMIVRDEEDVLGRCLESVADLVDEIIIVDTGSKDHTREIARRFTPNIYDFTWIDDFAAARNFSFSHASCDYCMWLDADDIIAPPDRQKFLDLKKRLDAGVDVVMLRYYTGFDEQGRVTFSYYRERIIRNRAGMVWKGAVHEVIETRGNVRYSECGITHWKLHPSDPDRNLHIFEKLLEQGTTLDPRQQFYYGRELYYHKRYQEALKVLENFLKEGRGWIENSIEACRQCAYCWYALGDERRALEALFSSFAYDIPRAETCCDIGQHFLDRECWERAAYWYVRALECERRDDRGGFVLPDAYGYLPCIQLCVCYSRLGRQEEARRYNERAAEFQPDSPAVAYNRAYFAGLEPAM
ncbi:glycosyltransferase [Acutalibacter sp. 1XD8-33]|uniref:glycosyltransferase n=1 Tax=Acutalibacter sp. 1XD8-33 TaxID=2320081 RepID=UPI000EA36587|nr:glycosyltransferase [Acutalibacter sp. 1XD8-33]RKJ40466.1 glycosyltransferase [Acutalibacter sp. 1XD8-33]